MPRAVFMLCFLLFSSLKAFGFHCFPAHENKVFDITINFPILTASSQIDLVSLATQQIVCSGNLNYNYQDAIRIVPNSVKLHRALVDNGYLAYLKNQSGTVYSASVFPDNFCIWPTFSCIGDGSSSYTGPLHLTIGFWPPQNKVPLVINPLEEVVRFTVQQRSNYGNGVYFGANQYKFIFRNRNVLAIPSFSCSVYDKSVQVNLPPVSTSEIRHIGIGRYPNVHTNFSLKLSCDAGVRVQITFDAESIEGFRDVIKNTNVSAESIGIQILDENENPVVIGERVVSVESASEVEVLKYKAFYYYKGGLLEPGRITSLATVIFDYQ